MNVVIEVVRWRSEFDSSRKCVSVVHRDVRL